VNDQGRQEDLSPRPGQPAEGKAGIKEPVSIIGIVIRRRINGRGTG